MTQLLQNAAYGTALILAAALLRRVLKDRLIPEARLALWAVCLFRLLTPAAPESVLSLWGLFRPRQAPAVSAPAPAPAAGTPQLYTPVQTGPVPAAQAISWETALLAVWLVVGGLLAARYVLSWRRTRRAVACTIPVKQDDPRYLPLPKCARLREGPMEGAPLTFGAVKPTVVLTPGLRGEALDCVLAHEGVHAKRRDNLWHYAMALALVVHWWNPAVWLMARLLRRDIELSCDRAAVKKLGAERRAEYANALVSMATQESGPAFCQTFGRKAAEERILSVMKFKKTSVIGVVLSLALVLAVTVAFASEPKQPDGYSTTHSGESTQIWSMSANGDNAVENFSINVDYLEKNLAQHVADGTMTQEEANRVLALAREAAVDGELKWTFSSDSGLVNDHFDADGNYQPGFHIFFKDADGNLHPLDPATVVSGFIFPAAGEDQPNYVDPDSAVDPNLREALEAAWRDQIKNSVQNFLDNGYTLNDYDVRLSTFDEDGNPVSSDGGIVGEEFYAYEFVSGSDNAVGGKAAPVPSAEPARSFDDYTIVGMDENGYPVDEQGNSLVFDDNGNLFMKVRTGYGPCIKEDCSISDQHYHKNGEVIYLYSNDPGLLCTRENCHETEYHEHDGLTYKPILNICTRDGCGDTGVHEHDGVIYKGWTDKSTYIGSAASSHDNREGHHVEEPATHHSESHNSSGHH